MTTFKGETPETVPPFLGADFWEKGTKIAGEVLYGFDTENGPAYAVQLLKPVELESRLVKGQFENHSVVALGNLKGFAAALRAAKVKQLLSGDKIHVQAIGEVDTGKESPMVRFSVEVTRE